MPFVNNSKFLHVSILRKIEKENVFYYILDRKNAFLDYKNIKLKKWKKYRFFQKGSSMIFVKSWQFFHLLI